MRAGAFAFLVAVLALTWGNAGLAQQAVLQRGYDAGVTGANLTETALNTSNVQSSTFGLVFKLPVDDNVYAQPLYVPGVSVAGQGTHNVVYVATMSDTLYAFDADTGAQLWSTNFAASVNATPVLVATFAFAGNRNIVGNMGILSTPVIDPSTNILYLVACTLESGAMVHRLHAVDITSGNELITDSGVILSGSYGGLTFDSRGVTQRVSLALSGNQVVIAFGALEAEGSNVGGYSGWVMAYDKTDLSHTGSFATETAGSHGGGVWQSGRPPAVDASGYVYAYVGNAFSSYDGVHNFNESVLKLDPSNDLGLVDWFTPGNWAYLDANDLDLSSAGPLLIPNTDLLAGGGKAGVFYMLDTDNLGRETANDSGAIQEESITSEMRGGVVFWNRSAGNGGPLLYDWGANDVPKSYAFGGTTIAGSPSDQGSVNQIWPGGILAISANGGTPGTGILWATAATSGDANNNPPVPGILYALDATNLSSVLWSSAMNSARDNYGLFAKFVPPLVSNGRVYVATSSNQVAVYGLLTAFSVSANTLSFGNQLTNIASSAQSVTVTNTGTSNLPITGITLSTAGTQPFSQTNTCGGSLAVNASCRIAVVFDPAAVGAANATLRIAAGNGAGAKTVALTGTGIVPTYSVSSSALSFGNQLTNVASVPQAITVTNTGSVALPITGIGVSTPGMQPFAETTSCGSSLGVGAACTINVVFDPASVGAAAATLAISVGSGAAAQSIALAGTGIAPTFTLSTAALTFGNQLVNVPGASQPVLVTNTSAVSLSISGVSLSTSGSQPFVQTNICGSLASGASCTISVAFDPASAGAVSATLSVTGSNGAGTQTVALTGTGIVASYSLSQAALAFGNQFAGLASSPKSITVTNSGTVTLPIAGISLSTPGTQPFSATSGCGAALAPGATCGISVVFDPAAAGPAAATLTLTAGSGAPPQTVALTGSGIAPTYSLSAATLDFGSQLVNAASAPKSIVVTNSSAAALPVTGITLSSAGTQPFAETNDCGPSLAAGATCSIGVMFDPAAAGAAAATLNVALGDGAGTQSVALAGTGSALTVTLTATPATIGVGGTVTLTWNSTDATSCSASGGQSGDGWAGTRPTSGTASVTTEAVATITYTLSCTAGAQSAQATAQVAALTKATSGGGGGAVDWVMLGSLLGLLGWRRRKAPFATRS